MNISETLDLANFEKTLTAVVETVLSNLSNLTNLTSLTNLTNSNSTNSSIPPAPTLNLTITPTIVYSPVPQQINKTYPPLHQDVDNWNKTTYTFIFLFITFAFLSISLCCIVLYMLAKNGTFKLIDCVHDRIEEARTDDELADENQPDNYGMRKVSFSVVENN